MIKRLKAFVLWLESRFPEKVVVTAEHIARLEFSMADALRGMEGANAALGDHEQRLGKVESSAVHKDAVQDLITIVKALKDEVTAMKVNMGWNVKAAQQEEISAMLNGEVI